MPMSVLLADLRFVHNPFTMQHSATAARTQRDRHRGVTIVTGSDRARCVCDDASRLLEPADPTRHPVPQHYSMDNLYYPSIAWEAVGLRHGRTSSANAARERRGIQSFVRSTITDPMFPSTGRRRGIPLRPRGRSSSREPVSGRCHRTARSRRVGPAAGVSSLGW
jgi:hypothetical protein